jgi:phosphoketolase
MVRRLRPKSGRWHPPASAAWAPTRTPTAVSSSAPCACPTSVSTRSTSSPGADRSREHAAARPPAARCAWRNRDNFRVFGPDENTSNKLAAIYEASKKFWMAEYFPEDADGSELSADGRVMEMLSEHTLEGWLEGYLLTGRHGLFSTYEAFVHVIDSMFNQHAKWLVDLPEASPGARRIASLNLLITSTVWRQDHNGFTHQDPGFLDVVVNKSASVTRIYLPPDVNCLLSVADHCLRSENYVNVIVCDKQLHLQYLDIEAAITHCAKGIGIWDWASNDQGSEPDVVMAAPATSRPRKPWRRAPCCCGELPRSEDPLRQRRRPLQAAARQ